MLANDLKSSSDSTSWGSWSWRPPKDQNGGPKSLGQIALHPILPLLAVASSRSAEILLYSTETSKYLWHYRIASADVPGHSRASERSEFTDSVDLPYVTCLQFSKGNHVVAGLSNGTVHFMEQNLLTVIKSAPKLIDDYAPAAHSIKLLPIDDPSLYVKCVGRVTNLAFSPNSEEQEEGAWLAIATERAGVWIWSTRSRQIFRAVTTRGIGEGCLRWISLEGTPFSGLSSLSTYRPYSSVSQDQTGRSMLICGTLDGRIRVQQLWHSAMMMSLEQSTQSQLSAVAKSDSYINSVHGVGGGPVTHLLVRELEYSSHGVKVHILTTCQYSDSSLFLTCIMSHPSSPDDTVRANTPMANSIEPTFGLLLGFVDSLFRSKTANDLYLSQNDAKPAWLTIETSTRKKKAALISASYLRTANLILTTWRTRGERFGSPIPNQCIVFSLEPDKIGGVLRYIDRIRPLVPTPANLARDLERLQQKSAQKGYYTNMLARAGIDSPSSKVFSFEEDTTDESSRVSDHVEKCGQVAWGKGRYIRDLGAFLYEPGSLLDDGLAVGLFEIKP